MKLTEAIRKALRENKHLKHIGHSIFQRRHNTHLKQYKCYACALGLAVIGVDGLQKTHKLVNEKGEGELYTRFAQLFPKISVSTVMNINDTKETGEWVDSDFKAVNTKEVLQKLESKGL